MKQVSILIPRGHFSLVNVEGTHQILSWVNVFLQQAGREPMFNVQLVGLQKETVQTNGLFAIKPDVLLEEVKHTDLIVVPAVHGDHQTNLDMNAELLPWIVKHYKAGAELVSFCIGSFILGSTGLLKDKQCATHWRFVNEFRQLFPEAHLVDDKIMTEDSGIYTSGGAYSFLNLILYLVEKYAGRDIAILTAKTFMIDIDKNSQSPFIIFTGQKSHLDKEVIKAQEYIEQHFQDKITVEELSEKIGVGRRTFERRFKQATCNTITEYMQRVKVEAAKKQLETGRKTVNEVMYDVGYTDVKAFREVFKKVVGMSPLDYRNKYNAVVSRQ